jgi:hypothetical protein
MAQLTSSPFSHILRLLCRLHPIPQLLSVPLTHRIRYDLTALPRARQFTTRSGILAIAAKHTSILRQPIFGRSSTIYGTRSSHLLL